MHQETQKKTIRLSMKRKHTPQSSPTNKKTLSQSSEHHSPFPFLSPPLSWGDNQEASLLSFLIYLSSPS
ncbi:hypothetical protein GLYMA_06G009300v4 [Glycine max]|uniref:Uncharacterized protein n=1 Tax=Glycine max TaxID=3847 RepID=A0A0R0J9Z8_SOYBN|nr:hypothetical protein GYH30_013619 [Glycine max]KRH51479.1 hypothetical protein GLYMA_06G009300v4 [Glycine max]